MSFSPVFYSVCKKCNSIWWLLIASLYLCIYLFGSLRASSFGGGRAGGEKEDPPPRELTRRLSIWGSWRCWRLSLLKDCRLYAPHSQIWPEYKLETASCLQKLWVPYHFSTFPHQRPDTSRNLKHTKFPWELSAAKSLISRLNAPNFAFSA